MMDYQISDNTYKSIFETNLDAILISNSKNKILDANPIAELLFGYSYNELIKLELSQLLDTTDLNLTVLLNRLSIKGRVKGEITLVKKDGSHFPAEISAILLVDENTNELTSMNIRDITDLKQVEESLIKSNIKLDTFIGSMTDAVFISDVEGNFIDFNDAFATYHRFKNKEECYKTFKDFTDYIDVYFDNGTLAPLDMWAVPRALRGETASNIEYILRRKDTGETWWGSYSFAPIKDKNTKIIGSIVVGHEITHRKLREKALRDSEKKYRNIIDNIQDAYIRADNEGKIIMASSSAANMYGFHSTREMMGLSAGSFYSNPDDRVYVLDELNKFGKLEDNEAEAVKKDGTIFWVSQNAQNYYDEKGQIQGTETFVRDITERKNAEEALRVSEENYRHLIQYAPTSIYEIDYNGPRFKSVNDSMCHFSGYSREELLSMNPFDLLDSESGQIFQERINEGLAGEKITENVEFRVLHKYGRKL
ncbi:MAG: PAS domain-containing protein [Methanobacterium sp.]